MANCSKCGSSIPDGSSYCPSCGARQTGPDTVVSDDVNDNRGIALLSYLGPLCLVPFFKAKRSPFAHYHAVRGLNLFILECAYTVLRLIFSWILSGLFGTLVGLLLNIGYGFFVYLSVMGIIHVIKGQKKDLPFVGSIRFVQE